MLIWSINCLLIFLLCVFFAGVVIPQILLDAFRKNMFDVPDERKIHQGAVPRLGGIAFKPVMLFSFSLLLGINMLLGHHEVQLEMENDVRAITFCHCAIILLYLTGMADDLVGIRYKAKFVIQILCGIMLIAGGIWMNNFHGLFWIYEIPAWIGYPLTVLLTVFIINAINLIDGIDGLASGLCGIASLSYGIIFFVMHQYLYAVLSFAMLGVLVPFFYYNVFGNPEKQRKIFMGDTGSLTIGMMLCALSIKLFTSVPDHSMINNPMVLAYSPLIIPCCDVVRVFLHRIREGKSPFLPDKNHIHHKLLAVGMKQRTAMITIIFTSFLFTICNIFLSMYVGVTLLLIIDIAVWTIVNMWLTRKINRNQKIQSGI